jgi:hypothetical protein
MLLVRRLARRQGASQRHARDQERIGDGHFPNRDMLVFPHGPCSVLVS